MSNDVLEWEASRLAGVSEQATRLQEVDAKMQVLVMQVQTGVLSEEGYVAMVQAKIEEEKRLAKALVKVDREQAQMALRRAKIMQKELEGE